MQNALYDSKGLIKTCLRTVMQHRLSDRLTKACLYFNANHKKLCFDNVLI